MASLFSSLFSKAPQVPENVPYFPYTLRENPYQCKKTWPPDFTKLSPKHQFRLERRYRRRSKLKWARPNWTKGVKIAQWGSIVFVCVYGALYLDVGKGETPFDGIRKTFREQLGGGSPQASTSAASDNSPTANEPS